MSVLISHTPLLIVFIPLVAGVLILASQRDERIREGWTIVASIGTFLAVLSLLPPILQGDTVRFSLMNLLPGLSLGFEVDAFGLIFALTSSSLWIANSLYSIGYMKTHGDHHLTGYFFFFAMAIASALGIAMAVNLFTMFVFYEILTVSTYPLVVHARTEEARQAGRKYLAYLLTAGIFFLFSLILTYSLTGDTTFVAGGILEGHGTSVLLKILFMTFLIGFAKAAWMPLHSWLPSAMVAPTPVSALLHAVAVVKAGAFGIVRVVCYIFGIDLVHSLGMDLVLATIAVITILIASLFALAQDNLKRRLAYSTVSQLSYILLGVSLLTPAGITGALVQIPFHAFMKITLFFAAGAILVVAGIENISEMKGIGRRMPVTMIAFSIGAIGICGFPPVCGVFSKWYLGVGTIEAGSLFLLLVIIGSTVLNVAYFFPILYTAFFDEPTEQIRTVREAPLLLTAPMMATALITILLFFQPAVPFLTLAEMVARAMAGVGL
jgi:multicomponent Na+:H+ antiporter subunit D